MEHNLLQNFLWHNNPTRA